VEAWETSDGRLFAAVETEVAQQHEAKLIAANNERQLRRDYAGCCWDIRVKMNDLRDWLKANPELTARLVNS
jgi:hypothetical protein